LEVKAEMSSRPKLWTAVRASLGTPFQIARPTHRYLGEAGGEAVRIACVGRPVRFRRLLKALGGAEPAGTERARSLWAPSALARVEADLLAVEIHPWAAASFRGEGWAILPRTVRWCAATADTPPARRSRSLRSDLRLIAAGSFTRELSREPDAWRELLCRMVVPLLRRRFGRNAAHPSRALVRRAAADGEVLFVVGGEERLGGLAALASGTRLWAPFLGVRDGDRELVRRGVIAAAYHFAIQRARELGLHTVDIGRTTPYLDQGLVRYKAKWGFAPERDLSSPLVAIRIAPSHRGLEEFFRAHPVLVETGSGLARFLEGDSSRRSPHAP
jgi:hypothetical protein